jgi:isoquinoline 1-oxidoreductase beta subunit
MRKMGAAAREMLIRAASDRLQVSARELALAGGMIRHAGTGKSVTFGEVADAAAKLPVPTNPKLRADSSLEGRSTPRWDVPAKVDGSAEFGIDVRVPDMLTAALRRAPRFGARLASYDTNALQSKEGVVSVVALPDGVAVVGKTYWQAHCALDSANLTWSAGGSTFSSGDALAAVYAEKLAAGPFFTHLKKGGAVDEAAAADRHVSDSLSGARHNGADELHSSRGGRSV